MSPKLFSIYVEDLLEALDMIDGGLMVTNTKFNVLMYADDIIVMSTTKSQLQLQLDRVGEYQI